VNRIVHVYSIDGKNLRTYEGKVSVNRYLENGISFSVDGQTVVVTNAIIIIEEKEEVES